MSKKAIISIIIFLLVLAVGGWYFIAQKSGPEDPGQTGTEGVSSGGFFGNFFPFGGSPDRPVDQGGVEIPPTQTNNQGNLISSENTPLKLQQLTSYAVAGATSLSIENQQSIPLVRFIEQSTGNIYEIDPSTLNQTRITNTTIPAINEVLWSADGEDLVVRYLNENNVIKTFLGEVTSDKTSTTTENSSIMKISGSFIEDEIPSVIISPTKQSFAYLKQNRTSIQATQIGFDNNVLGTLFTTQHNEWIIEWPNLNTMTATTKASNVSAGYLYHIDLTSGVFSKILGGVSGLTTSTSPDAKNVLYSASTENGFVLKNLSTETRETQLFSLTTLPEKCVWSTVREGVVYCGVPKFIAKGEYPDDWYKGTLSFSDEIWEIDVERNVVRMIASPQEMVNANMDIINLFTSDDERYLFFTSKKDGTLWSLMLEEIQS